MKSSGIVAVVTSIFLVAPAAYGQEPAGLVKTLQGTATAQRDGKAVPLAVGDKVLAGDRISTGPASYAGITLKDDTLIGSGPNSSLVLDRFSFEPRTHSGNLLISISRGVTSFVTGLLARSSSQQVAFRTQTATIGIRGTEFIVEVEGEAQ